MGPFLRCGGGAAAKSAGLVVVLLAAAGTPRTGAALTRSLRGVPAESPGDGSVGEGAGALLQLDARGDAAEGAIGGDIGGAFGAGAAASCDLVSLGGTVCYADHRASLTPAATVRGLVGRYTFDEAAALDSSGHGHHGNEIFHGPSPAGTGHSAFFQRTFVTVPNSAQLQKKDFSYSFWVYLIEEDEGASADDAPRWCPLLRKGVHLPTAQEFASSPALLYSHGTGQLRASVTTSLHPASMDGEYVDSNARLLPNRWVHLALVHHEARLLLYVNGILDAVTALRGNVIPNAHPLYVGGDPFTAQQCVHAIYMDELRVYDRALPPHELQAEGAVALGGTDPSFVHLGCASCGLLEASRRCPASRHLCSTVELHTGAFQVARALGWLHFGAHVWTLAALRQAQLQPQAEGFLPTASGSGFGKPTVGLGLCCDGAAH